MPACNRDPPPILVLRFHSPLLLNGWGICPLCSTPPPPSATAAVAACMSPPPPDDKEEKKGKEDPRHYLV